MIREWVRAIKCQEGLTLGSSIRVRHGMATQKAGSIYHISALRYAEASQSFHVGGTAPAISSQKQILEDLFEKAENNYRPGQSSSSSLLIRSNIVSTETVGVESTPNEADVDQTAREGFQRTKARALLAQTTSFRDTDAVDQTVGLHGFDHTGSIYLRNRRAYKPLSRHTYEQTRIRKRASREKGKAKRKRELQQIDEEARNDEDEEEEEEIDKIEAPEIGDQSGKATTDELKGRLQADAEQLRQLMPSGSMLETIHYLAAHYYDACGLMQAAGDVDETGKQRHASQAPPQEDADSDECAFEAHGKSNMYRLNDGNALVALAVFLEETVKHEMATKADSDLQQRVDEDQVKAANGIGDLRDRIKKGRRRRAEEERASGKKRTNLVENGWARKAKRRRPVAMQVSKATTEMEADSISEDFEDEE